MNGSYSLWGFIAFVTSIVAAIALIVVWLVTCGPDEARPAQVTASPREQVVSPQRGSSLPAPGPVPSSPNPVQIADATPIPEDWNQAHWFRPILYNGVPTREQFRVARAVFAAYTARDAKLCAFMPNVTTERISHGDYSINTASSAQWRQFCSAVLGPDPSACTPLADLVEPNLQHQCRESFIQASASRNTSPRFCIDEATTTFRGNPDLVRNCLSPWIFKTYGRATSRELRAPFTQLQLDLYACLGLERASRRLRGTSQQTCLFDLAQRSGDALACRLISDPYPTNPHSLPTCLRQLAQRSP
ncbi:MAG TPA: hypothetical protein VK571_11275 [Gemmatimonadaceae bacterium]|nr:hypothetical protein [Gemmatimonadaceae bacterium]